MVCLDREGPYCGPDLISVIPMKFLPAVTKTIRRLGLVPLCPLCPELCPLICSNCGWPVFHKNVQFRRDDVERSLKKERNFAFSLPRPYCRKCMNELGVEAIPLVEQIRRSRHGASSSPSAL